MEFLERILVLRDKVAQANYYRSLPKVPLASVEYSSAIGSCRSLLPTKPLYWVL